ncbi:hypothetical protein [Sphingomonas koreensis]
MNSLLRFIRNRENREILSWLGGGAVAIVAACWMAITFFWDSGERGGSRACAIEGSMAANGNINGSSITIEATERDDARHEVAVCHDPAR